MRRSEVSSARYAARVVSLEPAAGEPGVEAAERAGADAPSAPERPAPVPAVPDRMEASERGRDQDR